MIPIPYVWTGQAFEPHPGFLRRVQEAVGAGEVVTLVQHEDRSGASHRHYFAAVNEAWQNLPEALTAQWPSVEHLRKAALIRAGYRDERSVTCASRAEALRVAAFVRPLDDYALVTVHEATVTVYTAKSQSVRAMGKQAFQDSKEAVLRTLADMIDVTPAALGKAAAA